MTANIDAILSDVLAGRQPIKFTSEVTHAFKWAQNPPTWASVFTGSNDRGFVPKFDTLAAYLKTINASKDDLVLFSVIGGMYFFDMFEQIDFGRVELFDANVAEHAKIAVAANIIAHTPYEQFDSFRALDAAIRSDPGSFYLPAPSRGVLGMELTDTAKFSIGGRVTDMSTMLNPTDYPEYAYAPSRQGYERVQAMIKGGLSKTIRFGFPKVSLPGKIAVVFLSNCAVDEESAITPNFVRQNIWADLVIPVYAAPNDHIEEPHQWWEYVVRRCLLGKAHHVWAPEDRALQGSDDGRLVASSSVLEAFIAEGAPDCDTVLLHILNGKNTDPNRRAERDSQFRQALRSAAKTAKRIVVAEFNAHGSSHTGHPCLPTTKELLSACVDELDGFFPSGIRYAPGFSDPLRNMFLVFDRAP